MCRLPLNPQSGEVSQGLVVNYATKEKKQKSNYVKQHYNLPFRYDSARTFANICNLKTCSHEIRQEERKGSRIGKGTIRRWGCATDL